MAKKKTGKKTINKSSETGKIVSEEFAAKNPNTTYKQSLTPKSKKP